MVEACRPTGGDLKRKRIVPEDDELAVEACRPRKVWIGSGSLSSRKCMDWMWKGVITEEEGLKVEVCRSERVHLEVQVCVCQTRMGWKQKGVVSGKCGFEVEACRPRGERTGSGSGSN